VCGPLGARDRLDSRAACSMMVQRCALVPSAVSEGGGAGATAAGRGGAMASASPRPLPLEGGPSPVRPATKTHHRSLLAHPLHIPQMIPLSRIIELSVVTAFYAGICYMLFDGACELKDKREREKKRGANRPGGPSAPGRGECFLGRRAAWMPGTQLDAPTRPVCGIISLVAVLWRARVRWAGAAAQARKSTLSEESARQPRLHAPPPPAPRARPVHP